MEELQKRVEEEILLRESGEKTLEIRIKDQFLNELEIVKTMVNEGLRRSPPLVKSTNQSIPRGLHPRDVTAEEEERKRKEEIKRELAESENKIQRRSQLLQEEEEDEGVGEEARDEDEFDDEDEEPEESSFLESDEEEKEKSHPPVDSRQFEKDEEGEGGNEDDDLSVQSSDSSSQSDISMKETSRIGDSLDESMEALESFKQRQQQKLTSLPSSKLSGVTSIGLSYEVDSLGNMIPVQRKKEEQPNVANQSSSAVKNVSLSSGSLLGSGGRNKTVPLQQGYGPL
jgi:hypothetical protein